MGITLPPFRLFLFDTAVLRPALSFSSSSSSRGPVCFDMAAIASAPIAPSKVKAIANLTSFHFDQSKEIITLSDDFLRSVNKSMERCNIDANFLRKSSEKMSNVAETEELLKDTIECSEKIQREAQKVREKLFKIFENPHEHDLRLLREQRTKKERREAVNKRVDELANRRKVVKDFIDKQKKEINSSFEEAVKTS